MPQIEIRPAVSADVPYLMELEHYYQTHYVWQVERTSTEEGHVQVNFREVRLPRQVRVEYPHSPAWLKDAWNRVPALLVAVYREEAVGYITVTEQLSASTAWVQDLVVAEKLRRKGIASGLLLAAQEWAGQHSYKRIIMEMQSKNHPSIRLATRLGYEFCGYHDHYYANQDIALFFARYIR